jgi:hypothetical protein
MYGIHRECGTTVGCEPAEALISWRLRSQTYDCRSAQQAIRSP